MISFEQTSYTVLEGDSSTAVFEVCVVIVNGPGIVPQMDMDVSIFSSSGSDGGTLRSHLVMLFHYFSSFVINAQTQQRQE